MHGKDVKASSPLVRQLRSYLDDDGVLRYRGRLENSPLDEEKICNTTSQK